MFFHLTPPDVHPIRSVVLKFFLILVTNDLGVKAAFKKSGLRLI